jgi:hypothetical protein
MHFCKPNGEFSGLTAETVGYLFIFYISDRCYFLTITINNH